MILKLIYFTFSLRHLEESGHFQFWERSSINYRTKANNDMNESNETGSEIKSLPLVMVRLIFYFLISCHAATFALMSCEIIVNKLIKCTDHRIGTFENGNKWIPNWIPKWTSKLIPKWIPSLEVYNQTGINFIKINNRD